MLRAREKLRRRVDEVLGRQHRVGRAIALGVGKRRKRADLRLLQAGVEVDVRRAAGRGVGDLSGAQDRLVRRRHRGRLVVPLGVVAHQRCLVGCGVDPVDPGTALRSVPGAGRAENEHRHTVAPGVEDRHAGVHEADVRVHYRAHHPVGGLGVPLSDRNRRLLVQAQQHLRPRVAEIVHDAVVQAAVARSRIEREEGNVERAQHRRNGIAPPDFLLFGTGDRRFGAHGRGKVFLGVHGRSCDPVRPEGKPIIARPLLIVQLKGRVRDQLRGAASVPTTAKSASTDSRERLRVMNTMRERRSSPDH